MKEARKSWHDYNTDISKKHISSSDPYSNSIAMTWRIQDIWKQDFINVESNIQRSKMAEL